MAKESFQMSRRWTWISVGIASAVLLMVVLSYFISSDALRRYMERQMNQHLTGYTVHIERAYLHPVTFSLDLENLILTQNSSPGPPVASIRRLHASVHWRELLTAHLVADFLFENPKISINLKNVRKEEESRIPFRQKGWQEALESIYPLKINVFRISNGEMIYQDEGPYKPLHVSRISFKASNIRNIRFPENVYPSSIRMEGTIFDKGTLILEGRANFLEEPHLGVKADLDLTDMDLGYFEPIIKRSNILVKRGSLSTKGTLEYNPQITAVNLKDLIINGVYVDYLHLPRTVVAEQERVEQAVQTTRELSNKPTAQIRVDILKIEDSSFGYINRTSNPNYRLFIDHAEIILKKFSNQMSEGPSTVELKGKFMGSGKTRVTGTFRPRTNTPDFSLNVAIEDTQMAAMSDLFRSFGNFDIKDGNFSFYSELEIKGGTINGYVKPLFKGMKVYDRRGDREKGLFHKLYIGMVGGVVKLLENRPRKEVATKTDISGPIESPKTSTWQTIINLIRNAFIKSILPGFEKEVTHPKSSPPLSATDRSSPAAAGSR